MSNLMKGKALVIQIGDDETRVACLTLGAKVPQVLDSTVFATPEGAVQDGVIQNLEALRMQLSLEMDMHPEFRKARKAVFVLQSTQVISQSISVPQVKNKKRVEQLVQTNADLYFPVDITGYQLTWQVVGHTNVDEAPMTQIQLWATPKSLLNKYYLLASDCGLTVAAVDYCGHSFASGINASFAKGKVVKKAPQKPKKAKKGSAYEEYDAQPIEDERTTLFINLEKSHILMSFVQEGQVLLQRMFRRSDYLDTDLNEMFMEMEYFHAMFPACVSGDCVVSGSEVADTELVAGLEEVAAVPLQRLHCEPDQIWCMHLGASLTELDFGDAAMNIRGAVSTKLGSPWQYVAVALGGAALVASVMLFLGSSTMWNTDLQGLRSQQNGLMLQLAESGSAANEYKAYEALYNAYSADWDTVFGSVRTYNDNACLMLEELESILPSSAVVTNMSMTEQSLALETAFQSKEDVVYFLVALRDLQYAELVDVSDLIPLAQQAAEAPPPSSNTGSALMDMMSQLMGGGLGGNTSEKAPTEGDFEPAPTEGSKTPYELYLEALNGTLDPATMLTPEFIAAVQADDVKNGRTEPNRLEDFLVDLALRHAMGTLTPDKLSDEEKVKIQQLMVIYAEVNGYTGMIPTIPGLTPTPGNTGIGNTGIGNTGTGNTGIGNIGIGNIGVGTGTGNTNIQTNQIPTGKELEELLAKYELTEQHLKEGLDELSTAQFGVLDKHYTKLYERYTLRALLKDGATLDQRKAAIRSLLETDALAMHQFFILLQEDEQRQGKNNVLMGTIHDDFWEDPTMRLMIYDSDQAMLDEMLPKLIDILVKNEQTVSGTEALIRTHYNLTRKLAGHLAVAMKKESSYSSVMNFSKLQNDILSGKTKKDEELDAVVRDMLTPKALDYYNTIQLSGIGTGTGSTGGAGGTITDILDQLLGGGTGSGGQDVVLQELPGNFAITVTLGYKPELILAEQARKGLDYDAKVLPVWEKKEGEAG